MVTIYEVRPERIDNYDAFYRDVHRDKYFPIFILGGLFQNHFIAVIVNLFSASTKNQSVIERDVLIEQNFLLKI